MIRNNWENIIGMIILLIVIIPFVSAATDTQDVDDIFRINTLIEYKKPCFNNGTYCSGSSTCNFSVFEPSNKLLIDNRMGTNNIAYHNISFYGNEIGIYKVDMTCIDGSRNGAETLYFEVTGSGFHNTIWFYILILAISAGIMILGFNLKDAPIVILGTFGLYFLGIYSLLNGIAGIRDMITTYAISIIILGLAGYISIKSAWELIND